MHRLLFSVIGIVFLFSTVSAQTGLPQRTLLRDSLGRALADTVRLAAPDTLHRAADTLRAAVHDSLARTRVDTIRILPMRSVGSLSPASLPYPGLDAMGIIWNEYRTLTDLIAGAPGVFVRDMGSPGQDNQVTIGGASSAGTAFLVDGVGQNDPATGTYNFAFFPIESIERIELVTGPRSFLYGDNAVGGTVNVITKNYSNNKPYTRIRYSQGGNSYAQTDAMFSQNIFPRFNLSFGLSYLGYGSSLAADLNRGRYPNADNEAYTFRTKFRYNVSHTLDLTFTHFFYSTETGLNGGGDLPTTLARGVNVYDENAATVVNYDSYEKRFDHHAALSAIYRPLGDSTLGISLSGFGAQLRREYRDEENRLHRNGLVIRDDFGSRVLGARGQLDYALDGNLLSAIAEAKSTRFGNSIYGPDRTQSSASLSVKDEFSLGRYGSVALYEKMARIGTESVADFGGDATLHLPGSLTLSAGTSVAHRHLPIDETYQNAGGADTVIRHILTASGFGSRAFGTILLRDEIHHVSEASLRFAPEGNFQAGIVATRRVIDHWVDRTYIQIEQTTDLTVDCVTASVRLRHGNFFLDGDATYTKHTSILRGATPIRLYPEWRGEGSLYFHGPLAGGHLDLKAGVRGRFYSEFEGEQFTMADAMRIAAHGGTFVDRPIGNAGTVDLFIVAHIGDAYIHVLWDNLTNSAYMLTPFYPMYDRTVRFDVSWEFVD